MNRSNCSWWGWLRTKVLQSTTTISSIHPGVRTGPVCSKITVAIPAWWTSSSKSSCPAWTSCCWLSRKSGNRRTSRWWYWGSWCVKSFRSTIWYSPGSCDRYVQGAEMPPYFSKTDPESKEFCTKQYPKPAKKLKSLFEGELDQPVEVLFTKWHAQPRRGSSRRASGKPVKRHRNGGGGQRAEREKGFFPAKLYGPSPHLFLSQETTGLWAHVGFVCVCVCVCLCVCVCDYKRKNKLTFRHTARICSFSNVASVSGSWLCICPLPQTKIATVLPLQSHYKSVRKTISFGNCWYSALILRCDGENSIRNNYTVD